MSWQELSPQETHDFIQIVKDERLGPLFDPHCCKIKKHPLPFYNQGQLISIENFRIFPPTVMDYIECCDEYVYLDGSPEPFLSLNSNGHLTLNENTIIDYLQVYLSYVIEQPENILLLKNPENMHFKSSFYMDFHFDKNNYSEKDIKITDFSPENGFAIHSPFVFNGKIDRGIAKISPNGTISVKREDIR